MLELGGEIAHGVRRISFDFHICALSPSLQPCGLAKVKLNLRYGHSQEVCGERQRP